MMSLILAYLPANFFSMFLAGLILILAVVLLLRAEKMEYLLVILLLWFPFESVVLRFTPINYYSLVKYFPEVVLYLAFFLSWVRYFFKEKKLFPANPLNIWLGLFLVITLISFFINQYRPLIFVLGLRQVLRFVAVYYLVLFENFDRATMKKIFRLVMAMVFLEALLGVIQYLSGGFLDKYLFFSQSVNLGGGAMLGEIEQFWAPGKRVFATMGRYDRLGSFLAFGLAMTFPLIYKLKNINRDFWYYFFMITAGVGLLLTSSRASWIGAAAGIFVAGVLVVKDRRIWSFFAASFVMVIIYFFGFIAITENAFQITEKTNMSFQERVFEAFSWRSWQNSYEGYGRIFFIINTPLKVVANYPLFGVGLGNYGGGVASAMLNYNFYDRLSLPFGISNIYGQIDNSWFSIWGESGTLGLICWLAFFIVIFRAGYILYKRGSDGFAQTLGLGFCALSPAIVVIGFFGPYFEFRALMFYFWLMAGILMNVYLKDTNYTPKIWKKLF
ncbi:MAG TPA: O-antigen ligase family protein [Candidatus Magasanikbacteria bacterium]|nr:O-antigen ligase family protein [Candidatus Magasanikbacteria bacterium]